jgi:plastocyanin
VAILVIGLAVLSATAALAATKPVGVTKSGTKYKFNPATLSIKKGDTVKWSWSGSVPHNVSGPGFQVEDRDQGDLLAQVHQGRHLQARLHHPPGARPARDGRRRVDGTGSSTRGRPSIRRAVVVSDADPPRVRSRDRRVGIASTLAVFSSLR